MKLDGASEELQACQESLRECQAEASRKSAALAITEAKLQQALAAAEADFRASTQASKLYHSHSTTLTLQAPWFSLAVLRFTNDLTRRCSAQEQASEIKALQEKNSKLMESEGQLRRDLEAEQKHAKVLRPATNMKTRLRSQSLSTQGTFKICGGIPSFLNHCNIQAPFLLCQLVAPL